MLSRIVRTAVLLMVLALSAVGLAQAGPSLPPLEHHAAVLQRPSSASVGGGAPTGSESLVDSQHGLLASRLNANQSYTLTNPGPAVEVINNTGRAVTSPTFLAKYQDSGEQPDGASIDPLSQGVSPWDSVPSQPVIPASATRMYAVSHAFDDANRDGQLESSSGSPTAANAAAATVSVDTTSNVVDGDTSSISALLANRGADGKISFPEALAAVNNTGSGNTINFNLAHGSVITVPFGLTLHVSNTLIHGDVDGNGAPDIILEPQQIGFTSLHITSDHNTIEYLATVELQIDGAGAHDNDIIACYFGTDVDGRVSRQEIVNGVEIINGAYGNTIQDSIFAGLSNPAADGSNGLAVAGIAIRQSSHDNKIVHNHIGVNVDGAALGNDTGIGITGGSYFNTIGGARLSTPCDFPCNVISGNRFNGVVIYGEGTISNVVQGNYIGLDPSGTTAVPNGNNYPGVALFLGAAQNLIGGMRTSATCDGPCNVISGNASAAIIIDTVGTISNVVQGNYIGLSPNGIFSIPNASTGIAIFAGATRNTIGGLRATAECNGPCNVIGGNARSGIAIQQTGTMSNVVQGNFIGLNSAGTSPIPNSRFGIALDTGASQNLIGGQRPSASCSGPCNVIAGNTLHGISLIDSGTLSNTVQGNYIGVSATGSVTVPNGLSGVAVLTGTTATLIGGARSPGDCTGICNVIRGNAGNGVTVVGPTTHGITIRGNEIRDNGKLGIDLGDDGVTANDQNDADSGPNDLINFPRSATAVYTPTKTIISGAITVTNPGSTTIDLYASQAINPSAFGEGQRYVGSATPDSTGHYTLTLTGKLPFPFLSATATDADGSTSEFSLVDTDGDDLPDQWEQKGITIQGTFIDLPKMGASPLHKDLFVHTDWMTATIYKPDNSVIKKVIDAFGLAPLANPDGKTGVHLHVDLGPGSLMDPVKGTPWGTLSKSGQLAFKDPITTPPDWSDVDNFKKVYYTPAHRDLIFHYACFCTNLDSQHHSGWSRSIPGTDFVVTLGGGSWLTTTGWISGTHAGTPLQQAGTFMHELGHNLGLHHGGDDEVNKKPNYLSVMNYTFQTVGLLFASKPVSQTRSLDYSRRKLPTLNETMLSEATGISDPDKHDTFWSGACATNVNYYRKLAYPALDWNCDGTLTPGTVAADINSSGFQTDTLKGFEDWSAVRFDGGGQIGLTISTTIPARVSFHSSQNTYVEDNTYEYLSSLVPPEIFNAEQFAPVDVVTASVQFGGAPLMVHFDGTASFDPDGSVVSYSWDFGDGTIATGPTATHTYTSPGTYFAWLTVTDNDGHLNLVPDYQWITVEETAGSTVYLPLIER